MTELTITPKVSDKTARFKGAIAAGEHVAVTIKGGAGWMGEDDGANLVLRVLDLVTGRTLAVFPRPTETLETNDTPDAWSASTEDSNDLYCELNLNTTRMVAAARHMLRVPVLFVLGDSDVRTLYFRDRYEIEYWPERIGDTTPYDLDNWPKKIDDWTELIADFDDRIDDAEERIDNAVDSLDAVLDGWDEGDTLVEKVASAVEDSNSGKVDKVTNATSGNFAKFVSGGGIGDSGKSASDFADAEDLEDHTGDSDIHVTVAKKEEWNGKADKVGRATAGNFAGLDQYGNLTDSGKKASDFATGADKANLQQAIETEVSARTDLCNALDSRITTLAGDDPSKSARTIAAEEVAKIVASADTDFDTLKEIADWILNDTTGAAKMANDIEDLKSEKANVTDLAAVATSGSYNDLDDKPTIPSPISVVPPSPSATAGQAADAKATGDALYGGFTPWVCDEISEGWTFVKCEWTTIAQIGTGWFATVNNGFSDAYLFMGTDADAVALTKGASSSFPALSLFRHLITPTKTSQLTNDGAPNGGGTPYATTAQVAAKQDALSSAQLANIAAVSSKANATDLPYAMVEPGKWTFSGLPSSTPYAKLTYSGNNKWLLGLYNTSDTSGSPIESYADIPGLEDSLQIVYDTGYEVITATRPSLPGRLLDRANNLVDATTGDVTLTLPPFVEGKVRDLLVHVNLGDDGANPYTVTVNFPSGESNTAFVVEGDDASTAALPAPTAAGTWWYSFTECEPHKFAVSLKQLQTVAAQGGS